MSEPSPSSPSSSSAAAAAPVPADHVSSRGMRVLKPPLKYFKAFGDAQQRRWSKEDPDGNIIVVVAENKLSSDLLHERLQRCAPPEEDCLYYAASWKGHVRLRRGLAALMERTFMEGISVDPEHISVLAGAGAILDNLFWCIGEAGEGVLIPRPYYPSFDTDLKVRSGMVAVPFDLDESRGDIAQQLDAGVALAQGVHGVPTRAVLLTNPNNPMSTMYRPDTLLEVLRWCMEKEVHLVSDEIYAMSVWGEGAAPLRSLELISRSHSAQLPGGEERAQQLLHVVFGLSKDFCASGLRMGCLHTRNATVNSAMSNLAYFCFCSGHTQLLMAELLEDTQWVDGFLEENRRRMRHSYTLLSEALTEARIPFVAADSAMFCWVDLREGMRRPGSAVSGAGADADGDACVGVGADANGNAAGAGWAEEHELWEELAYKYGVLLTPGETCHAQEPGFFRMCWAWVPGEALPVAVRRIRAALDARSSC